MNTFYKIPVFQEKASNQNRKFGDLIICSFRGINLVADTRGRLASGEYYQGMLYKKRMRRALSITATGIIFACVGAARPDAPVPPPILRKEFARRLEKVEKGMDGSQVEKLLGKPDYQGHLMGSSSRDAVWFYGCAGPRKLPTLGTISFNAGGRIYATRGTQIGSPSPGVISEKELRQAMLLLDEAPDILAHDPGAMIRVANGLIPMGKTKVLAAIKEYHIAVSNNVHPYKTKEWKQPPFSASNPREAFYSESVWSSSSKGTEGLVVLMRVIFDVPTGNGYVPGETKPIPPPAFGLSSPPPPLDGKLSPRFPIILIEDIPLLQSEGSFVAGMPENAYMASPYFSKHGKLRTRPLTPTDRPWETLSHLEVSPAWLLNGRYETFPSQDEKGKSKREYYEATAADREDVRRLMKRQILKLLAPLYPSVLKPVAPTGNSLQPFDVRVDLEQWDTVMEDLKRHPARWNPTTNQYDRAVDAGV